jgi:hypothetical protein
MAPRLHPIRHKWEEDQLDQLPVAHGDGTPIPVLHLSESELAHLLDFMGVNDLAHVEGANDRTVQLSDRSELVCPAHERTLKPDACKSCRYLAGEG